MRAESKTAPPPTSKCNLIDRCQSSRDHAHQPTHTNLKQIQGCPHFQSRKNIGHVKNFQHRCIRYCSRHNLVDNPVNVNHFKPCPCPFCQNTAYPGIFRYLCGTIHTRLILARVVSMIVSKRILYFVYVCQKRARKTNS